ncbi:uncharacterized protein E0L32_009546 [Thyridium curvatum]|uniref:Uncharacterized protein n=1 Tax=Thyridium curvatum TaxID=1093900 RepID=A0A507ANT3_9PEZI|nr:uncharacterized protein E0L32_009546 [Thyridium curvatum]TPX08967.1 hypothetical protein E0L32_009546 [Thyridium curvatum]
MHHTTDLVITKGSFAKLCITGNGPICESYHFHRPAPLLPSTPVMKLRLLPSKPSRAYPESEKKNKKKEKSDDAAAVDPLGYGRVAIVTGCASGIGLACTQLLLAHQFSVCGLDAAPFDYNLLLEAHHGRFHFTRRDLTEPGACEEGVRICLHTFGNRVDLLVNVAGVMDNFASADAVTDDVWNRVLAVNLTVPVMMMRSAIPFMRERGGSIVNVASTAGVSGAVAGVAYTASKHGLGIRCNAVLPGAIDSSIGKAIISGAGAGGDDKAGTAAWDAEAFAEVEPVHALQARPTEATPAITPHEVARTIIFLSSDAARTLNGVSLPVDQAWGVV